MKYQKGFKFMDNIRDYEIIEFMERHNMYRLKNLTDNREDELMQESEIDGYIARIETIKIKREKNRIFLEKQEAMEKAQQEKELKCKQEYEFCYGYTDNKKKLQKGKILKILNVKEWYNNQYVSRKYIIENIIKNYKDVNLDIYNNTNRYSQKRICLEYKKLVDKKEYRLYFNDCFINLTKTEYDYASYLIKNNLIQREAV